MDPFKNYKLSIKSAENEAGRQARNVADAVARWRMAENFTHAASPMHLEAIREAHAKLAAAEDAAHIARVALRKARQAANRSDQLRANAAALIVGTS